MSQADNSRQFRDALGRFATGIAVVTACAPDGQLIGLTINSFNSVSLNPPLVLWSLDKHSPNRAAFITASHYAINILSAEQEAISQHFATRQDDKFASIAWEAGLGGAPLLPGCCAQFQVENQVQHPGGDHLIFVGQVAAFTQNPELEPLLYFGGSYRQLSPR